MNFSRYYRNEGEFIYGFDPGIITWDNGSYILTVWGNLPEEEMMAIANSVCIEKNKFFLNFLSEIVSCSSYISRDISGRG